MKKILTFSELYNQLQVSNSQKLNSYLEKAKKEKTIANCIALAICIVFDFLIYKYIFPESIIISSFKVFFFLYFLIFNIIIFVFANAIITKKRKKYTTIFKTTIIHELLNNFYDNLIYMPTSGVLRNTYDEGEYNEYYNRYKYDDYTSAKIDNLYDLEMSEVHTIHRTTSRSSNGSTSTHNTTIFHGLFIKFTLDKSINGQLRITSNQLFSFDKNKLDMDSNEFEKSFDVFASNKIVGMQLLTADIMEDLLIYKNTSQIRYDIFINNNNVYLRFHCGPMFEAPSLNKGAFDEVALKKYYDILEFTHSLSKKLIHLIHETEL